MAKFSRGAKGCIAAGHSATATAGADVLAEGGNAVDAAMAAALTSCVVEPVLASLGGGGFVTVAPIDGPVTVYDFFTQTPCHRIQSSAGLDFYPVLADFGTTTQEFHIGMASIAVPGLVQGVFDVLADHGSLRPSDVFAPAIEKATNGIKVNEFQARLFDVVSPIFMAEAESRQVYGSGATPNHLCQLGDTMRLPDLAATLSMLANDGPDSFYKGALAEQVVQDCKNRGGLLTIDDFRTYQTERRSPTVVSHRDATVFLNPPPSAGGALIGFALKIYGDDLCPDGWGSEDHLSRLIQAMIAAHVVRQHDAPAEALNDDQLVQDYRAMAKGRASCDRGTTQISVIDADGNAASVTLSNGEGCGYIVPGTGVMMNNMLGEEDLNPNGFHKWHPGSRIISMMAPTIARRADGSVICLGSGGSNRIRSAVLQVLLNVLDFDKSAEQAVSLDRLHFENAVLDVEPGLDPTRCIAGAGHISERRHWPEKNLYFGGAHLVTRNGDGDFDGAGDPRRGGVAITVP